jgi:predicted enzyme related to lactoylglutathione lyase
MSDTPLGRFVWFDLMTTDPRSAQPFYGSVAGWGTEPFPGPMEYTMWTREGAPLGGSMPVPSGDIHPHWLAYVSTPDTDATVARAKALGAQVMVEPADIPTVGRYAVLTDPQGVVFAVYTSADATPDHGDEPKVGEFSWHELMTTDHAAAADFYTRLFGWELTSAFDMGGGAMYQMFGRNGRELGGMFTKGPDMPAPSAWVHYIRVDDINAAVERIKAAGGQVVNGPMEVPGGDWIAQAMDPQGAMFAVHAKP